MHLSFYINITTYDLGRWFLHGVTQSGKCPALIWGLCKLCAPNEMIADERKKEIYGVWEHEGLSSGLEREANRQGNILSVSW